MLAWLREAVKEPAKLRAAGAALRVVSGDSKPSAEEVERLSLYGWGRERHGGSRDLREGQEWYDLLHETQGDPQRILTAGVIEDASGFPADSLFAEWGYVVDIDASTFEVYEGLQRSRHDDGRFAGDINDSGYYPVRRVACWSFGDLPADAEMGALEGGDEE